MRAWIDQVIDIPAMQRICQYVTTRDCSENEACEPQYVAAPTSYCDGPPLNCLDF